jgi:putative ABC transport system substrate-binding protein
MRRRDLIKVIAGSVIAWPLAARTQQQSLSVIGWLNAVSAAEWAPFLEGFRNGLKAGGYVEGKNVALEYCWAEGQYNRLPALAAELVDHRVAVIVATGAPPSIFAAKAATATIPIVFATGTDPVTNGLVSSLDRPGGNITGVSFFSTPLGAKRMELLREVKPNATRIAILVNPSNPNSELATKEAEAAANLLGQRLYVVTASSEGDFDAAFAKVVQERVDALIVNTDGFFNSRRAQLVALAAHYAVPTIYYAREFVAAGGLMSYGASIVDAHYQAGVYTSRILKGEKPSDLPIMQPTHFELAINDKAAKALGIIFPGTMMIRADEVIE